MPQNVMVTAPLDNAVLSRVLAPIAEARGLPNECYTDATLLRLEQNLVFAKGWFALGFGKDVPHPGDVAPVDGFGIPLLMARDKAGGLRVFHNVCSHRGMRLVEERTRVKGLIRCAYHSWCYALDGDLKSTPSIGGAGKNDVEGFERKRHGLKEVRSREFMGVVFVNLEGEAEDFDNWVRPLDERWRDFAGTSFLSGGSDSGFEIEVRSNWKLAVENYCESYHLPWVHPGLNSYSRLEDHYDIRADGHDCFSGQGTTVYRPTLTDTGDSFPLAPGLGNRWESGAEYIALYPNALLGIHKDHYFAIVLEPLGPNHTRERVEIFYYSPEALGDRFAGLRAANARLWRQVFEEDVFAVEGMQRGRASPGFEGGVFSPVMDGPTHDFHAWMARRLMTG